MSRRLEQILALVLFACLLAAAAGFAFAWDHLGAGHTMNPPARRGLNGHWR